MEEQLILELLEDSKKMSLTRLKLVYRMKLQSYALTYVLNLSKVTKFRMETNVKGEVIVKDLLKDVCRVFSVSEEQLTLQCRKRNLVSIRHLLYFIGYHFDGVTLVQLGDVTKRDDHTTVKHGYERFVELLCLQDERYIDLLMYWRENGNPKYTSFFSVDNNNVVKFQKNLEKKIQRKVA